jgi:SAM-dependent methyltransferase
MNQWSELAKNWQQYESPLRPSPEDVAIFKQEVSGYPRVLLLGVTPELQSLCTLAVDNNPDAIQIHGPVEKSLLADWRQMPLPDASFDVIFGDGSLNVLNDGYRALFKEVKRVLRPGGKLILRVFTRPELPITFNRDGLKFHAFKLGVSLALANPFVSVKDIQKTVKPLWDHPTMAFNRNSDAVYYFPKLSELPYFTSMKRPTTYQMAEHCPIVTWTF